MLISWDHEVTDALEAVKCALLDKLKLYLLNQDEGFVLCTDALDCVNGAVLEQGENDGTHSPVAFWS